MGMLPHDFWHEYTYGDFILRSHYFYKERRMSDQAEWERARYLAVLPLNLQYGKGDKQEMLSFPWDTKPRTRAAKPITRKEIEGLLKTYPFLNKN